jgi:hypothetical protein
MTAERADEEGRSVSVTLVYCMNCGCTIGIRDIRKA